MQEENIGGVLVSEVQGVWEIYTLFPIAAEIPPIFPPAYKDAQIFFLWGWWETLSNSLKIFMEKREEHTYKHLGMPATLAAFVSDPDNNFTTDPWSLQSTEVEELFLPYEM